MKLVTAGFLKKFVETEDKRLKAKKQGLDNLNLALETKHNPFKKPIKLQQKNFLNDPDLFIVSFERIVCP